MTHEYQDEKISMKHELESLRQFDEEEEHNARYELIRRYAPEGYDFYADCEYLETDN